MHKPSIRVDPFKKVSVNGIKVRLSRSVLGGLEGAGRGLVVFGEGVRGCGSFGSRF